MRSLVPRPLRFESTGPGLRLICAISVLAVTIAITMPVVALASGGPEIEWQKTFGGATHDSGESVQQTTDGGYILGGFTGYETQYTTRACLVKTDSSGNLKWKKSYGKSGGSEVRSVQQTKDGGYIFAGYTNLTETNHGDAYLVKTSSSGAVKWEKTFGGATEEWAESVQQTPDGGYVLAGGKATADETTDVYLVKTNSNGTKQWEKMYGGDGSEWAECIQRTKDGGYILAGYTNTPEGMGNNAYLVKTNSAGEMSWDKDYGGVGSDWFQFVQQADDGGYIIAGGTDNHAHLVKTNASGKVSWDKVYSGETGGWGFCTRQTRDGGYILSGYLQASTGWNQAFLVKTDSAGNTRWLKSFGGEDGYSSGHEVQQTADGGYVVGGFTDTMGFGGNDMYLVKLQSDSDLPYLQDIAPDSGPVGTLVSITGSAFGEEQGTSYVSFGDKKVTSFNLWTDSRIETKVPAGVYGDVKVSVTTTKGRSNDADFTGPPPPDPVASPVWYLAEGSSDWGFDTYITLMNPNSTAVTARVVYMTSSGPKNRPEIVLPALSQTVINPRNDLGASDFSTKVECKEGKPIVVDRRMIWSVPGTPYTEGHSSIGVISPAKSWYLPEGSSAWGFECWLLLQNPNNSAADCTVTYFLEGAAPIVKVKRVPPNSRASFNIKDDIGEKDASMKVECKIPVIPERAMYRNSRREGHESIGTTSPALDYYLAEGSTAWGFTTYVLIENPNPEANDVAITYMTPKGVRQQTQFTMPGDSRSTVRVNDVLPDSDLSIHVHGSRPLIAERAMYWDNGTGEAGHDSIGIASPHTSFYFPDGETTNRHETWTLVQNPNNEDVKVQISYLKPGGSGNQSFTSVVPAKSRRSYSMADFVPSGRAATAVTSKTTGLKILSEHAIYWNNRGAGTNSVGACSD